MQSFNEASIYTFDSHGYQYINELFLTKANGRPSVEKFTADRAFSIQRLTNQLDFDYISDVGIRHPSTPQATNTPTGEPSSSSIPLASYSFPSGSSERTAESSLRALRRRASVSYQGAHTLSNLGLRPLRWGKRVDLNPEEEHLGEVSGSDW